MPVHTPGAGCGYTDFTGTAAFAGARMTVTRFPDCPGKGVYSWSATATSLTLHAVSDACAERKTLLNGVWKKKS
jgi:hypothetical protein